MPSKQRVLSWADVLGLRSLLPPLGLPSSLLARLWFLVPCSACPATPRSPREGLRETVDPDHMQPPSVIKTCIDFSFPQFGFGESRAILIYLAILLPTATLPNLCLPHGPKPHPYPVPLSKSIVCALLLQSENQTGVPLV